MYKHMHLHAAQKGGSPQPPGTPSACAPGLAAGSDLAENKALTRLLGCVQSWTAVSTANCLTCNLFKAFSYIHWRYILPDVNSVISTCTISSGSCRSFLNIGKQEIMFSLAFQTLSSKKIAKVLHPCESFTFATRSTEKQRKTRHVHSCHVSK